MSSSQTLRCVQAHSRARSHSVHQRTHPCSSFFSKQKVVTSTTSKIQALQHAQLSETVYTPLSFKSTFAPSLTALETSVLLSVLERKRVLARSSDGEVIRLEFGGTDGKEGRDVGEIERGLLDIKVTLGMLEGQVESLQSKIAEYVTYPSSCLFYCRPGHQADART